MTYLKQRENAALQGQVYNPTVGFALVGNTGAGQKYPYNPFYGGFSPRVAVAWNPQFSDGLLGTAFGHDKTVVRGGYSRIFGRLNGVDLVLVPLLGTGLIQPVQCGSPCQRHLRRPAIRSLPSASVVDGNDRPDPRAQRHFASTRFPRHQRDRGRRRRSTRSQLPPQPVRSVRPHHSAADQQARHGRSRLHRPPHRQRISADQHQRRALHDDSRWPALRQSLCRRRATVLRHLRTELRTECWCRSASTIL